MLAATDGHARKFSIGMFSQLRFRLTPLYDVFSTWPLMGKGTGRPAWHNARLAMSARDENKHDLLKDIQRRHFNAMAAQCGLAETAEPLIRNLLDSTPALVASGQNDLPGGFPRQVLDAVLDGLAKSASTLEAMQAA